MKTINWHSDPWFSEHHAGSLSAPFQTWWISHYGTPEDYPQQQEEQDEYWQRCAFAWMGWQAATQARQ